ncbi:hypothetical protein DWX41_16670 [Hungatella hathewayi]|uniref:Scaffolding protein n=1 Tax=Hungatella hathewayi TaxID=154046 RepID=A0A3E2WP35_9FIRM|nr:MULTISPECIES: hypothetical protein [Clostridia]RGC28360.1 hypothetical protein DWX41_16670 [Hungatella hathewayi]GKH35093.1 hypothetical protein CE91St64_45000 [Faecalicatena contorta]
MKNLMKLDLQHFAEPAGGTEPPAGGQQQTQTPPAQQTQELAIDYEKLAQIVQGKQSVAEDSALRGYLKQQGLSKEQMDQAIATYKQQQAANQPDVGALQTQAAQAQAAAQQAQIQAAATIAAVGLGIDAKTIPYVLKMADLSQVMGEDGEINDEALKTALNKVLEDVPALKPAPAGQAGFVQVGASGGSSQQQTTDDALKKAFGL